MEFKWITPSATIIGITLLLTGAWSHSNSYRANTVQDKDRAQATSALQSGPKRPPEEKDVFVDEDLKEEKVAGDWAIASKPDSDQINDASTPVIVKAVATYSGQGKYKGLTKIRKAEVQNRSARTVNALQLRWFIISVETPKPILLEGITPLFDVHVEPNATRILDIPHIFLTRVIKPLRKGGELNGIFYIVLGVQEVNFSDGSTWKRKDDAAFLKIYLPRQSTPFPIIEKKLFIKSSMPPLRGLILAPCKVQPKVKSSAIFLLPHKSPTRIA